MASTLDRVPLEAPVLIVGSTLGAAIVRRLAELGVRRGATVTCLRRTPGGGRVLDVAGARIALGHAVLTGLEADPVAR